MKLFNEFKWIQWIFNQICNLKSIHLYKQYSRFTASWILSETLSPNWKVFNCFIKKQTPFTSDDWLDLAVLPLHVFPVLLPAVLSSLTELLRPLWSVGSPPASVTVSLPSLASSRVPAPGPSWAEPDCPQWLPCDTVAICLAIITIDWTELTVTKTTTKDNYATRM